MHLCRNNINLKIDIPYSLSLPYTEFDRTLVLDAIKKRNERFTNTNMNVGTFAVRSVC